MKRISLLFFLFILAYCLLSQPLQPVEIYPIVIDTDCGITDYRAISLLLSRPEIRVSAILISDGMVDPENGFIKVSGFLEETGKGTIPLGIGKSVKSIPPDVRKINQTFQWSKTSAVSAVKKPALFLLSEILKEADKKITCICLGPLTNLSELIGQKPELIPKIDRIVWYNDFAPYFRGFNYEFDSLAVKKILASNLRLDVISNLKKENAVFDTSLLQGSKPLSSDVSGIFHKSYQHNLKNHDLTLSDELVAVYLCNPFLFDMNPLPSRIRLRYNTNYNLPAVREVIADMANGIYHPEKNIVFTRFPAERKLFSYDVRQIMDTVISSYGEDEWKACVITDEFHGHLGIYSIVGAKMGIRAREIFGIGPDILQVVSYAGLVPPYSCLNDGLQVSTGSTLGLGLISVAPGNETRVMADFSFKGKTIRISLKEEYLNKLESDINEGIVKFGLMDEGYWKLIRQAALRCWLEWDRNIIFNIGEIPFKQ